MLWSVAPMRYRPMLPALVVAGALSCPAGTQAETWQTSLAVTSDYILRGVSQTNGDPAVQASVTYWHPTGWYGGTWASNVDTAKRYYSPAGSQTEVNLYLGMGRRLDASWVVDAKAVYYLYLDDPAQASYDYTEFAITLAWRERIYGSFSISPDSTLFSRLGGARDQVVMASELSLQQPLSPWITWRLGAGYQDVADAAHSGYAYGGTSLALQFEHVALEVGYYRTDDDGVALFGSHLAGDHTVLTAILNF